MRPINSELKKERENKYKKTLFAVLTLSVAAHNVRDSCIAMRQKAVMEASESVPPTFPYSHTHTHTHTHMSVPTLSAVPNICLVTQDGSTVTCKVFYFV